MGRRGSNDVEGLWEGNLWYSVLEKGQRSGTPGYKSLLLCSSVTSDKLFNLPRSLFSNL